MAWITAGMETEVVGAAGKEWDLSFIERILLAGRVIWFYSSTLFWPVSLTFIYPRWAIDAAVWWQYVFPLSVAGLGTGLVLLQRRIGRAPLTAVLFFIGTLVPALGFFNVYPMRYSYVADHFQYLASIGLITLAGGRLWYGTAFLVDHPEAKHGATLSEYIALFRSAPLRFLVSSCVLLCLGILTWRQGYIYKDAKTLWRDTIQKNPSGWMAYNNLGTLFGEGGNSQQALLHFEKAVSLNPKDTETHHNLCFEYGKRGNIDLAIQHGLRAVELRPGWANPYTLLGTSFQKKGELKKAATYYRTALERNPRDAQAYYKLGVLFVEEATSFPEVKPQEAVSYLEEAAARKPNAIPILDALARTLATHPDPIIRNGKRAVQLAEAVCQRTDYRIPTFLDTLATAYAETRQFSKAAVIAQQAAELAHAQDLKDLATQLQGRAQLYRLRASSYPPQLSVETN